MRELWGGDAFFQPDEPGKPARRNFKWLESPDGRLLGAIGLQVAGQHGSLHSEAYTDFAVADKVAAILFWERIQVIAANHGVFRLWTRENSPFWNRWGFRPASGEILERLPAPWRDAGEGWFTLQLKDEDVINAVLEKETAAFKDSRRPRNFRDQGKDQNVQDRFHRRGHGAGLGAYRHRRFTCSSTRLSQGFGR